MKLRFSTYAWGVLAYNVLVVLWGTFVRATGSGAGCGAHWPLCDGQVIPLAPTLEKVIEYSHRISSGLALVAVGILVVWAFRAYPKGHIVRKGAVTSLVFIILEALIGAAIVLLAWVAKDPSVQRAFSTAIHLANTFLLLGALTLTAWWAMGNSAPHWGSAPSKLRFWLLLGLIGTIVIGMTGAVIALGDTLFPAQNLIQGLEQKFDPNAHFAVRLRLWHPLIAIGIGAFLIGQAASWRRNAKAVRTKRIAVAVIALICIQWLAGLTNVILLAPVWMQVIHLLLADFLWILQVLLAHEALVEISPAVIPVEN